MRYYSRVGAGVGARVGALVGRPLWGLKAGGRNKGSHMLRKSDRPYSVDTRKLVFCRPRGQLASLAYRSSPSSSSASSSLRPSTAETDRLVMSTCSASDHSTDFSVSYTTGLEPTGSGTAGAGRQAVVAPAVC